MRGNPCYKCEERVFACHDRCSKYQTFRSSRDERSQELINDRDFKCYLKDAVDRMSRNRRGLL